MCRAHYSSHNSGRGHAIESGQKSPFLDASSRRKQQKQQHGAYEGLNHQCAWNIRHQIKRHNEDYDLQQQSVLSVCGVQCIAIAIFHLHYWVTRCFKQDSDISGLQYDESLIEIWVQWSNWMKLLIEIHSPWTECYELCVRRVAQNFWTINVTREWIKYLFRIYTLLKFTCKMIGDPKFLPAFEIFYLSNAVKTQKKKHRLRPLLR